jgi:hypothetical protein
MYSKLLSDLPFTQNELWAIAIVAVVVVVTGALVFLRPRT